MPNIYSLHIVLLRVNHRHYYCILTSFRLLYVHLNSTRQLKYDQLFYLGLPPQLTVNQITSFLRHSYVKVAHPFLGNSYLTSLNHYYFYILFIYILQIELKTLSTF